MEAVDTSIEIELPQAEPLPADRFLDRELSWLAFNNRVLDLAKDKLRVPLLERAKFLAIFASNLDEFFMVRVAGLKRRIAAGVAVPTVSGMMPREVHQAILNRTRELVAEQARVFTGGGTPRARRARHRDPALGPAHSGREGPDGRPVRRTDLPGADPARGGPVAPVPLHLRAVDQPRGAGPQSRDRRTPVRPGQGADRAVPVHPAGRGPLRRAGGRDRPAPQPAVQRHAGGPAPHLPGDPQRGRRGRGGRRREPAAGPGEGAAAAPGRPAAGAAGGRGRHRPQDAGAADQRAGHHRARGVPPARSAGPARDCSRWPTSTGPS